jgi:iron-sulfur cluster repair protein YtfE (RIC family)
MELFDKAPAGYYDEKEDQSTLKMDQSRNNRITLAHLNQIRKSHDVRKLEHEKKLKSITKQYSPPPEAGAGVGGAGGLI